jgi:hypothetical protein
MRSICLLLNQFETLSQVPGVTATMSAIEILEDGAPCPGIVLLTVRLRIEREILRSMTAWLLMSSFHQGPVPPQVTAAGSCAHVTLPGTTPLEHLLEKAGVQKEKNEM